MKKNNDDAFTVLVQVIGGMFIVAGFTLVFGKLALEIISYSHQSFGIIGAGISIMFIGFVIRALNEYLNK